MRLDLIQYKRQWRLLSKKEWTWHGSWRSNLNTVHQVQCKRAGPWEDLLIAELDKTVDEMRSLLVIKVVYKVEGRESLMC